MSAPTILGLRRVGPARPLDPSALDAVERREGLRLPPSYRALLEAWGPNGQLCGFAYLLDPTDEGPHAGWRFYRGYLRGAALTMRRQHQQWRGVDDATWRRLVAWGGLDGKTLLWDTGRADAHGEYPVWFLDREGDVAVLAGGSLPELIERFLRGGGIDRVYPPAAGGRWEMTDTYVTRRPEDVPSRLRAALQAGDEAAAEAVLAEHRASVSGYEASAQLLQMLLDRESDALPRAARLLWLERAARWVERCCPRDIAERGITAGLAALRDGRTLDEVIATATEVDPACAPLTLAARVTRWSLAHVECVVGNPGPAASAPCALHAEVPAGTAPAPRVTRYPIPAIEPGGEYATSCGGFTVPPGRVRLVLRPA